MCCISNSLAMRFGFPDVCLTPSPVGPVPLPYPNFSFQITDIPLAIRTIVCGGLPGTLGDQGTISMGDMTGIAGVASGLIMGPARGILGSFKLFLSVMPAKKWCSPHIKNSTNAPGMTAMPGQFRVWCFS